MISFQIIIADGFYTEGSGACQQNPCQGGGLCEEHDNTYTCFCTADRTGERCEKKLSEEDLKIVHFDGQAFVELIPMKNVDHKVSIDLEFRVDRVLGKHGVPDGILVYAHQNPNADGDFISLAIVEG